MAKKCEFCGYEFGVNEYYNSYDFKYLPSIVFCDDCLQKATEKKTVGQILEELGVYAVRQFLDKGHNGLVYTEEQFADIMIESLSDNSLDNGLDLIKIVDRIIPEAVNFRNKELLMILEEVVEKRKNKATVGKFRP